MKRRWSFVALLGAAVACGVDALDLAGKQCPCTAGFVCDTSTNTCVTTLPVPPTDGGTGDPDAAAPDASGAITVLDLVARWETANGIRWEWKAIGDPSKFARYEIVTGQRAADVRSRASSTRVFDTTSNPELASFGGRTPDAGPPVSLWGVTDGHKEAETVFAQVIAYDTDGVASASDIASASTFRPRAEIVIYADGKPDGGAFVPAGVTKIGQDNPFAGASCLEQVVACPGASPCGVETGVDSIEGVNGDTIQVTEFPTAFLELAVRGTNLPGGYADVILEIGADNCGLACRMRFSGLSFGKQPTEWRLLQIPLSRFKGSDGTGGNLSQGQLSNRKRIAAFLVDANQPAGAKVGVDQVRIRW